MRTTIIFLMAVLACFAQQSVVGLNDAGIGAVRQVGSTAVNAFQPVMFQSGTNAMIPHTGTGLGFGIAQQSGNPGDWINVTNYGTATCDFGTGNTTPTVFNIATLGTAVCVDSGVTQRILISSSAGVTGRILRLRPDQCTNCADVDILFPAAAGTMISASQLSGNTATSAVANANGTVTFTWANGSTFTSSGSLIGPQGATGPQGNAGNAATVTAGTATSLPPGSTPTVSNSGTSSSAIFNFGVPQGVAGTNGTNGSNGVNGNTILSASGAPSSGTGNNGDFYLNTANNCLYGPKASGAWTGSCTSLVGPQGSTGATGSSGSAATIAAGTATSLSAGSSPTVSNSGTSSSATFNFGIPIGATGATGASGSVPFYNSSGLISGTIKCFSQTATTITGGSWSVSYSSMAFTATPFYFNAQPLSAGSNASQLYTAYPTSVSSTAISGFAASGTTLSILGATIVLAPASVSINVLVCGQT